MRQHWTVGYIQNVLANVDHVVGIDPDYIEAICDVADFAKA
jgi:hypothetical protein